MKCDFCGKEIKDNDDYYEFITKIYGHWFHKGQKTKLDIPESNIKTCCAECEINQKN